MFSGNTGAVVAAGEGLATSAPSYGLARDVMAVVDGCAHVRAAVPGPGGCLGNSFKARVTASRAAEAAVAWGTLDDCFAATELP